MNISFFFFLFFLLKNYIIFNLPLQEKFMGSPLIQSKTLLLCRREGEK